MSMHMGAPCTPAVQIGDIVTVGQCIGVPTDDFSVPIHASVSGRVKAISDYLCPNGTSCKSITIAADGEQTPCPDCAPPTLQTRDDLIQAARASGCVGLGGAGFPTHIKLAAKQPIDMLVINAAECEPYLTSDCRQIMEFPEHIIGGIELLMRLMEIPACRIGIEENKPAAAKCLADACHSRAGMEVRVLPAQYPQGAEKVLVYHTTGRIIPEGMLTADVGVLVINVSTCAFLYQYSLTGMPLTQRRVTLDGDALGRPCNVMAPIGTSIRALLEYAACDFEHLRLLLSGGPMMGTALMSPDLALCKPNNGILACKKEQPIHTTACIRCGRCMHACPMGLMPMELERAFRLKDAIMLQTYHLKLCINCGCCSYVCPAKRPLAESNQLAKIFLAKEGAKP